MKSKSVMYFGYCGQRHEEYMHIEKRLRNAVNIASSSMNGPISSEWSRCSRTDNGVHAICNAVSFSLSQKGTYLFFPSKLIELEKDLPLLPSTKPNSLTS